MAKKEIIMINNNQLIIFLAKSFNFALIINSLIMLLTKSFNFVLFPFRVGPNFFLYKKNNPGLTSFRTKNFCLVK